MNFSKKAETFFFCILFIIGGSLFISPNGGCKKPDEHRPPFDSLYPPPPAPQLIYPPQDTIMLLETPLPVDLVFTWSAVTEAEYFELQISRDSTILDQTNPIKSETNSCIYNIRYNGSYYWRVRAYNHEWTWYTEWSTIQHFGTYYTP